MPGYGFLYMMDVNCLCMGTETGDAMKVFRPWSRVATFDFTAAGSSARWASYGIIASGNGWPAGSPSSLQASGCPAWGKLTRTKTPMGMLQQWWGAKSMILASLSAMEEGAEGW